MQINVPHPSEKNVMSTPLSPLDKYQVYKHIYILEYTGIHPTHT